MPIAQGSQCSKNMRGVLILIMKNFAININKRLHQVAPFSRYARWFCWYRLFWNKEHVHFSDLFLFYLHSFDIIKVRFIREGYRKLLRCTDVSTLQILHLRFTFIRNIQNRKRFGIVADIHSLQWMNKKPNSKTSNNRVEISNGILNQ